MIRNRTSAVSDMRDAIKDLQELKTSQNVGNSQIRVKHTVSRTITVNTVPNAYNQYFTAQAKAYCRVKANNIAANNALIAYCIPKATSNGEIIQPTGLFISLNTWRTNTRLSDELVFNVNVFEIASTEQRLYPRPIQVEFHIWACADVELTVGEGNVEA